MFNQVSKHLKAGSKQLGCATSHCSDVLTKHSLSCFMYYFKIITVLLLYIYCTFDASRAESCLCLKASSSYSTSLDYREKKITKLTQESNIKTVFLGKLYSIFTSMVTTKKNFEVLTIHSKSLNYGDIIHVRRFNFRVCS